MAEINFNNLYNQLSPMDKMFYDQQFQKSYNPNEENLRLSGQENYDQMKAVYDAQQQVPEESFLDKINIFGSASAAEMPQVPNLIYRNIDLPFDLRTGITNTKAASPFKIGISEMLNRYNVPNSGSQDLVNQLIEENQMKANQFDPRNIQSIFPTSGIRQPIPLDMNKFQGVSDMSMIDETTNDEQSQEYINNINKNNENGLMSFFRSLPTPTNLLLNMMPKEDPGATNIRNFYGNRYGLTSTNSLASGIMAGRNPVFGSNFLNRLTGGNLPASSFGLANAARRRIEKIAKRKRAQTDASRAKIAELQKFARADTIERGRFKNPEVYKNAENLGLIDKKTGGFKSAGTNENFSNKTGRGRTGY